MKAPIGASNESGGTHCGGQNDQRPVDLHAGEQGADLSSGHGAACASAIRTDNRANGSGSRGWDRYAAHQHCGLHRSRHALHPIAIEVEHPVKPTADKVANHQAASNKTATP